jgi:hypothetical protein
MSTNGADNYGMSFSHAENQKLPTDGLLIGQTTERGKDSKGRLIVAYSTIAGGDPLKAAQNQSGSSNEGTFGRTCGQISYAIMGPAAKAIQAVGNSETSQTNANHKIMTLEEAQKLSNESKWLPDIFKKTFLVKVGEQFYDMNASSLKKAFGITKEQINQAKNRDITSLIAAEADKRLNAAKKLDEELASLNTGSQERISALNIKDPAILKGLSEAVNKDPKNGVKNYLNSLQVTTNPLLTIGELRTKNPQPGAQVVINRGLIQHLQYGTDLLKSLKIANQSYQIPAEINPEEAQNISTDAIAHANTEAQKVNPKNSITTISPKVESSIDFENIRVLREAPPVGLNKDIFSKTYKTDVQNLIEESRTQFKENPSTRSIIQAASQYNGAESPGNFTPLVGLESEFAKWDRTQGPRAQLKEQGMFQAITAAANRGFNAIAKVLSKDTLSMNKTSDGKTNVNVSGYLQVGGNIELTKAVTKDFCKNGNNLQSAVLKNERHDLVLSAAPSWQGYDESSSYSDEAKDLAYAAAYYNFSALFQQGLERLNENLETNIRICPTPIGCGAFANDPASVAKAFNDAALNFQKALTEEQKKRVKVEMQIFDPNSKGINPNYNPQSATEQKPEDKVFEYNLGIPARS